MSESTTQYTTPIGPTGAITDSVSLDLVGAYAPAGSAVVASLNGVVVGRTTAAANESYSLQPTLNAADYPVGLDAFMFLANTASGQATQLDPINVVHVPPPVNDVITADLSSATIGIVANMNGAFLLDSAVERLTLVDGTLSVGPDTNEATTQRLYEGLLGRSVDPGALSASDAFVVQGGSALSVAAILLSSAEYAADHGTLSDPQFVTSLYHGLLGRAPDSGGGVAASGQLAAGTSRSQLALGIANSSEAKTYFAQATRQLYVPSAAGTLAHELYETGLGREVDLASLASFKAAVASLTPGQIAGQIAGSAEFLGDHAGQSNTAFVNSLYEDGLGRPAGPMAGSDYWVNVLNAGATRGDVLLGIGASSEAAGHLTSSLSGAVPTYPILNAP